MNSYSYSKIQLYNRCPYAYYQKYVLKLDVFKDRPVFEKGRYIHLLLEHYPNLPEYKFRFKEIEAKKFELIKFISDLIRNDKKIKFLLSCDVKVASEQQFFLTETLQPATGYKDSMFNGKIDYVGLTGESIILVDWKTGLTQNKASLDQLKFYALWAFSKYPRINKVKLYLMFLEQNVFVTEEVTRKQFKCIHNEYVENVIRIENDQTFPKIRTSECIYCDFQKECNKISLTRGN